MHDDADWLRPGVGARALVYKVAALTSRENQRGVIIRRGQTNRTERTGRVTTRPELHFCLFSTEQGESNVRTSLRRVESLLCLICSTFAAIRTC